MNRAITAHHSFASRDDSAQDRMEAVQFWQSRLLQECVPQDAHAFINRADAPGTGLGIDPRLLWTDHKPAPAEPRPQPALRSWQARALHPSAGLARDEDGNTDASWSTDDEAAAPTPPASRPAMQPPAADCSAKRSAADNPTWALYHAGIAAGLPRMQALQQAGAITGQWQDRSEKQLYFLASTHDHAHRKGRTRCPWTKPRDDRAASPAPLHYVGPGSGLRTDLQSNGAAGLNP